MGSFISDYYGLIFYCPMGSERDGCVFGNVRQLSIKERLAYFDVLTEPEKMNLITKHQQCLKVREKSTLFHESQ
jgi:hypothetical protein